MLQEACLFVQFAESPGLLGPLDVRTEIHNVGPSIIIEPFTEDPA